MLKSDPSQIQRMANVFLSFLLSFLLSLTSFYLLTVIKEGICCACSHSHIHTLGWTPLEEGSARHTELYFLNKKSQQTSMAPAGFEPAIPTSERPQTYASHQRGYRDRHLTHYDCKPFTSREFGVDRKVQYPVSGIRKVQGGSNMTGTDLCVNKPHCAAAVRSWESEATTSTLPPARVRTCSVLSGSC